MRDHRLKRDRVLMVENYLVFYIVTDSEAQIHRVIHGARRYEFLLEPADRRELFGGLMSVGAKIAVVADIHGNLEALKAVLEDAFSTGIEIFICCGDLVDYGPDPNEAVERIRAEKIPCVLGNHDRAVGEPIPLEAHKTASGRDRSVELACLQWTREQCTEVTKAFLRALPPSLLFERDGALGGSKVLVVHATPDSVDDYLWPDDGEGWQKLHRATGGYDLVLLGHTHLPLARTIGDTLYLNPGSVGKPRGGDPRADYAVVEFTAAQPVVKLRKVKYDAEKTAAKMRRQGLPPSMVEAIRHGSF